MAVAQKRTGKTKALGQGKKARPPAERDVKPKVYHALKQAKKAADKAKTFEIQRLVKKLKTARAGGEKAKVKEDVPTLESQLQALKQLSADYVGRVALFSKLKKDKALSGHDELKSALDGIPPPPAQPASSPHDDLVRSRVLSNKHLASALQDALSSLHIAAGLKDTKKNDDDVEEGADDAPSGADEDEDEVAMDEDDASGDAQNGSDADIAMEDDEILDDDGEPVDDDGWESGSVDDTTGEVIARGDGFTSGSEDDGESDDDDERSAPPASKTKASSKGKEAPSSSMFLPSLSVGFTRGDSDSDWSDAEAKAADSVRKNRRGQRARQAIWEKKYGRGAKHVVKRRELETRAAAYAGVSKRGGAERGGRGGRGRGGTTGRGSAPSRGRGGSSSASRGRGAAPPSRGAPPSTSAHVHAPPKPAAPSKPVHPSWEAKQKQKAAAAIVPAQGQKIKFD